MWDDVNGIGDKSIVIVISPLNALIEDQVTSLKVKGIKAGVLRASCQQQAVDLDDESDTGSTQSDDENEVPMEKQYNYRINEQEMFHCVQKGEFKILFTHPKASISCKVGRKVF